VASIPRMRMLTAAFAASLLLALPSCIVAAAAVGAGAYGVISHRHNESTMDVPQELPVVFAAAKRALRAHSFPVNDAATVGATEGTLYAGEAIVVVRRLPGNITSVRASVGTFDTDDNERRARLLLEEIQKLL